MNSWCSLNRAWSIRADTICLWKLLTMSPIWLGSILIALLFDMLFSFFLLWNKRALMPFKSSCFCFFFIFHQPVHKALCFGNRGSSPQMTPSMCDCACVDWINTNAQYNHPRTGAQCCTSPFQAICSVPTCITDCCSETEHRRQSCAYISSQAQTSNHSPSHRCLSVHLNLRHIVSPAWFRVLPQWPATHVSTAVRRFLSQDHTESETTQTNTQATHTVGTSETCT